MFSSLVLGTAPHRCAFLGPHCILVLVSRVATPPSPPQRSFNHRLADKTKYRTIIHNEIGPILSSIQATHSDPASIDKAIMTLQNFLKSAFDRASPKSKKTSLSPHWWTNDLDHLHRKYKSAQHKFRTSPSNSTKHAFLSARKILRAAIKKAKRAYFHNLLQSTDNHWKVYKLLSRRRAANFPVTLSDQLGNPIILDPSANAQQTLDNFFPYDYPFLDSPAHSNVRKQVADFLNSTFDHSSIKPISEQEIIHAFSEAKDFGSPGIDGIFPAQIKWILDIIAKPLSTIFNLCLFNSYFPSLWKIAKVITIPKTSASPVLTSHKAQRPISLLPILGKCLEKIILERLLFISPNWFNPCQRGFIKKSGTEAALTFLSDFLYHHSSAAHSAVAVLQLDIESAFDKAWHPAILLNLIHKQIPPIYILIIASYLRERSVILEYGGGFACKTLNLSTPQGAVLSPFLWNTFLDTLLDTLSLKHPEATLIAWADDVLVLLPFSTIKDDPLFDNILDICTIINEWSQANKATISAKKSHLVCFYRDKNPPNISLTSPLGYFEMELSLTFLGIEFDSQLLFASQLTSTAKNIKSLLFSLKYAARTALKIPSGAFITMFIGAVIPKVLYGITCWSHALNSTPNFTVISQALRLAATIATRTSVTTPSSILFPLAGLPPPKLLLDKEIALRSLTIFSQLSQSASYQLLTSSTPPATKIRNSLLQHNILLADVLGIHSNQLPAPTIPPLIANTSKYSCTSTTSSQ